MTIGMNFEQEWGGFYGICPVQACLHSSLSGKLLWHSLLKVPKREIFDRSDFPDFYTMKSLRVGDFGVKIKNLFKNI